MSPETYIDQSARALVHTLVRDAIDPAQFEVMASAELCVAGLCVRAAIIGASHYLTVETAGGDRLSEVLACVDVREAGEGDGYKLPLPHGRTLRIPGGLEYRSRALIMDWSSALSAAKRVERIVSRPAVAGEQAIRLVETFPCGPDGREPRTVFLARWIAPVSTLQVETVHSYPNEDTIVLSRTDITLPAPGRTL